VPVLELPRGNAAKPVAPRPSSAYRNPPVRVVPPAALPHGTGVLPHVIAPSPRPAAAYVNPPRAAAPPSHTDVTSGGYDSRAANAYKQTPQYRQAVIDVFLHQNPRQQQAIVNGALRNPAAPEGGMVLDWLQNYFTPADARPHGPGILPQVAPGIPRAPSAYLNPQPAVPSWTTVGPRGITAQTGRGGPGLTSSLEGAAGDVIGGLWKVLTAPDPRAVGGGPLAAPAQAASRAAGKAVGAGIGGGVSGLDWLMRQGQAISPQLGGTPGSRVGVAGLSLPAGVGELSYKVPGAVAQASFEKPSTIPKTTRGLTNLAIGAIPGLLEAAQNPAGTIRAAAADYSRRYGPAVAGDYQALVNRIKASSQGAAPELTDILAATGGADLAAGALMRAGRTLTAMRAGEAFDPEAATGFFSRPRPLLRKTGGEPVSQDLAYGPMKITMQRLEDRIRRQRAGKGEIIPQPGEVTPIFGKRAQRVAVSGQTALTREQLAQVRNRELHARGSAAAAYAKLNHWEKRAAQYVVEGHIPLESGRDQALRWLDRHIEIVKNDRGSAETPNPFSTGNRIPAQYETALDNLPHLQALRDNVDKWLTPRLARYVDGEGARAIKIDDRAAEVKALDPLTAEARRLRVQGEALGHEHPNDTINQAVANLRAREADIRQHLDEMTARGAGTARPASNVLAHMQTLRAQLADIRQTLADTARPEVRQELLKDYIAQVRDDAAREGMPREPGYLQHTGDPEVQFGVHTTGGGHKAMPGVKQSRFSLWRGGAVDRSHSAYLDGLSRSIKRPFQWRLVSNLAKQNIVRTTREARLKALGRDADPTALTAHEARQVAAAMGYKKADYYLYNPGRLKAPLLEDFRDEVSAEAPGATTGGLFEQGDVQASQHLADTFAKEATIPGEVGNIPTHFLTTRGWQILPKEAYKEIHASLSPSEVWSRRLGKVRGGEGALILGGSPSFAAMNTAADALMSAFATHGTILKDMANYPIWFNKLSEAEKDWYRAWSHGKAHMAPEQMGSLAQGRITKAWRAFQAQKIGRLAHAANPFRILFQSQRHASDFLRQASMFSEMKRQALKDIGTEMGGAARALESAHQALHLGPTASVERRIHGYLQSVPDMEKLGHHTLSMFGDYTRFSRLERKYLNNRAVLFYSFLRFATRFLFYHMPLHHPIMTGLIGELSKLHGDEVRKILGGADMPWAYSRLFIHPYTNHMTSIDTTRFSPLSSIGTDVGANGLKGLWQTMPPEAQLLLNQIYPSDPNGTPHPHGFYSFLNDFASLSFPYRFLRQQYFGTAPQQDDSIPFLHERPDLKKDATAQAYQAAKIKAGGNLTQRQLASVFGLWPKPDNSQVIAANMLLKQQQAARAKANAAKKKKPSKPKPTPPSALQLQAILRALQQGQAPPPLPPKKRGAPRGLVPGGLTPGGLKPSGL